jgi:hypothetical protein
MKKTFLAALLCLMTAPAHADNPLPVNKYGATIWPTQVCRDLMEQGKIFSETPGLTEEKIGAINGTILALVELHCRRD